MSTIKFLFSSLFSNQTVIDESKKKPWWLAIILVVVSLCVAVIPSLVGVMTTNGSDIISASTNYSVDYALEQFTYEYLSNDSANKITMSINNGVFTCDTTDTIEVKENDNVRLLFKYVPDATALNSTIKELKTSYPLADDATKSKVHSMLLFTPNTVYLYLFDNAAQCTFTKTESNIDITADATAKAQTYGSFEKVKSSVSNFNTYFDSSLSKSEAYAKALTSWETFFDQAYSTPRNSVALSYTGMFLGLDALIIVIMALTVFLLSRTKTSINKYSYLAALKMVCFSSLSPAILAMAIGFMWASLQSIGFVLFLGLRITWLGMKATAPAQDSQQAVRK